MPTGSVDVSADSGEACGASLSAGVGQCLLTMTHLGAHTLTGSYAGDVANAAGSGTAMQTVNSAVFGLSVDDHDGYARYGEALEYDVILSNTGNASGNATLTATAPGTALDLVHGSWVCTDNGTGTGCADGSGALNAVVTVPAGHSMHWLVFVSVLPNTADTTATLQVGETGSANAANASDVDTLVLFRNGFELPPP